ncbi:MAG: (d)CMP kinase [Chloroflexi bacterium]|nr:(d)CMP kinase [Chloroflexota bacterium]
MSGKPTIAIDGPAASGKTVVGRELASRLEFRFLDTGNMYRAVTWAALDRSIGLKDEGALQELAESIEIRLVPMNGSDRLLADGRDVTDLLRQREIDRGVSDVSAVSGVRRAMVPQQRAVADQGPIVMVGRDIGTVVLPDARVKVFLMASSNVRARRRHRENLEKGITTDLGQVTIDLKRRDTQDTERADSPLRPADDALEIDTDSLSVEEVVALIMERVERI